jgi:AmmeMemoRadiSam system protein B
MNPQGRSGMKIFTAFFTVLALAAALAAQDVRPIHDDVGYCWNPATMRKLVEFLESEEKESFGRDGLVAAIAPHDDYLYAGRVDYPLFRILKAKEVVIFGVTHSTVRKEISGLDGVLIFDDFKSWKGLAGPVPVSGLREYLKQRLGKGFSVTNDKAQTIEHSIEAMVPFLQYFNPDVEITPIMVAPMPFARMEEISTQLAGAIADYMSARHLAAGKDIFFLISADDDHYGRDFDNTAFGEGEKAWAAAREFDQRLIRRYLTGEVTSAKLEGLTRELWGKTYLDFQKTLWCGKYSIPFGLLSVEKIIGRVSGTRIDGQLIRYSDTYSEGVLPLGTSGLGTTAPSSLRHWVSFSSIGYYAD